MCTATPTTWWLDDVAMLALDSAMANVIRTTITDFVVRPAGHLRNSSSAFKLGIDYSMHAAPVNVTGTGSFRDTTNTSRLENRCSRRCMLGRTARSDRGQYMG